MNNRRNEYTEVYTILQELNEEEYNKIPLEIIETLKANMNKEYDYELDEEKELKEQPMLPQTKAILLNIFRDYLSTPEQKEKIIKMQNEERQKNELKKKKKYDVNVFENKTKEKLKQTNNQENELVKYKENIFTKIINKIKSCLIKKRC